MGNGVTIKMLKEEVKAADPQPALQYSDAAGVPIKAEPMKTDPEIAKHESCNPPSALMGVARGRMVNGVTIKNEELDQPEGDEGKSVVDVPMAKKKIHIFFPIR